MNVTRVFPLRRSFQGKLRPLQEEAVASIGGHDDGVLCAPTAFGKTAVAAWMIAKRKVNTLVLVHRQQLLDQWHERLAMFLGMPPKSIGQIGGGKVDRMGCVDVAVIQSLHRKDEVKDFVAEYGQVIVDECHHISAFTFEQVMRQVKAKYVLGLTATPTRKDGHHPIIYMQCGPVRFSMSARTNSTADFRGSNLHAEAGIAKRPSQKSGRDAPSPQSGWLPIMLSSGT